MKEYIAIDELNQNREDFISAVYEQLTDEPDNIKANLIIDAFDIATNNPKITETDICKKFAYRLMSRIVYNIGSGKAFTYADAINNAIDSILVEMENEK